MKNTQNITIAVLTITAAILLSMVLANMFAERALAGVPSIKQGDYIMGTGILTNNNDLLYLINSATRRLNVYGPLGTGKWDVLCFVDLQQAFADAKP